MFRLSGILILALACSTQALFNDRRRRSFESRPSTECPQDCIKSKLDISFVVDGSASIWPQNFTLGLNFIEDFVNTFEISPDVVRVSLVTFGEVVYEQDAIQFSDYNDNAALMEAISQVPYRSGIKTNTSGGIWYMLHNQYPQAREGVRHVVIVMTDGNSQETALTKQAAEETREAGLEVFAIGVGNSVSGTELHNIASDDRHVFEVASYDMLEGILKRLVYQACDVPSYPECEMDPVDLSFVIDSSASIGEGNFTVGMKFVKDFVDTFQVNPSAVRVSAVTYGDVVYTEDAFNFNSFSQKKDVLDTLGAIQWRHGTATNTGAGIAYMRDHQMVDARATAAHIAIVITDGQSQNGANTKAEAEAAHEQGILMFAVGVGKVGEALDQEELENIAGSSSRVLTADNYAELNVLKDLLTNITCDGILQSISLKAEAFRQ